MLDMIARIPAYCLQILWTPRRRMLAEVVRHSQPLFVKGHQKKHTSGIFFLELELTRNKKNHPC